MSIEGLVFALAMSAVVIVLAVAPLLRQGLADYEREAETRRQRDRAEVYYERVLRNLRDLDEDRLLGKIDPAAYEQERAIWAARGVQVLKVLDQIHKGLAIAPHGADEAAIDRTLDDRVEAAVRDFKQRRSSNS